MATVARTPGARSTDHITWTLEELDIVEKPNGPALAAVLASSFGVLVLGIMTSWAEASTSFANRIKFQHRVGPLSGKTDVAGLAFVGAWLVLMTLLWRRNLPWVPFLAISGAMIGLGTLGTFPKFFELFAP